MSATLPRSASKADASRARILDAAARLFRDKGYAAVNLREIAARAGMKAGSLYYHFDSKERIVSEILDAGIAAVHREVEAAIDELPASADPETVIRTGILCHLRSLFEFSHYTSANVRIYAQVPPAVRTRNRKARRAYEALWDKVLERVAGRGGFRRDFDAKSFRILLISSMNATLEWFDPRRGNLQELARRYADVLLHGALKRART